MDDNIHKEYTGVSNKIILDNICRLSKLNKSMVIRVPIIYGVNDSEENIRSTALFVKQNVPGGKWSYFHIINLESINIRH